MAAVNNWSIVWIGLGAILLFALLGGGWLFSLPPAPTPAAAPPITKDEIKATLSALKPPKRQRPLIAIIGINNATEVTDYLMPYGILRRANVANVVALATKSGPVRLYPALTVEPQATAAEFDAEHPEGADYVVVPAMSRDDDPAILKWVRSQAEKGAIVVGICAGAKIVAAAGLLDGKQATTHWYFLEELRKEYPVSYVADRRLVVDQGVATTTGITASIPMMLTLIEAIAGSEKVQAVARDFGQPQWDARHRSDAFQFTRPFALTAIGNTLAVWNHQRLGIELRPGIDEVSLALVSDAWSRTYRSRAVTFAATAAVESRSGIRILPDEVASDWPLGELLSAVGEEPPTRALDRTLQEIGARYGAPTADFVAMQLEYPRPNPPIPAPVVR